MKISKEILTEDETKLIDSYINEGYEQIDNSRTEEEVDKITVYTKQLIENVGLKYYEDIYERILGEEKYTEGDGTYKDPYIIDTKGKLIYLSNNTNNGIGQIAYYELKSNIDLDGIEWIPIKSFQGHFNGNGYEISNYKINQSYKDKNNFITYIGLFGYNEGVIENLGVINYNMNFKWECEYDDARYINIGGISGYCISYTNNINNCYSQMNIDVKYINKKPISSSMIERNSVSIAGITNGYEARGENNLAICTYSKDILRCRFSYEESCEYGINNYYYTEEQKGTRGETTLEELNTLEFYINTLGWKEEIWDLSNVIFKDGKFLEDCYPKLKK